MGEAEWGCGSAQASVEIYSPSLTGNTFDIKPT